MNWLKRLFHREEPEPVEPPKPEPPAVESCPICGCTPKPKHVRVTRNYHYYCLEKIRGSYRNGAIIPRVSSRLPRFMTRKFRGGISVADC